MANDIQQQLGIFHKLGHQLISKGIDFIRGAYKLNPILFVKSQILVFLSDQTGIPMSSISMADMNFYVETWGKWEKIIDYDLIDQQQYLADMFDCENFAFAYSALATLNYRLNSCGVAFGNIYDAVTGKFLFRHGFNMILAHENGALRLHLYEPQTDEAVLWQKGKDNILPTLGWKYVPDWLIFW